MSLAHIWSGLCSVGRIGPVLVAGALSRLNDPAEQNEPHHEHEDQKCHKEDGDQYGHAVSPR